MRNAQKLAQRIEENLYGAYGTNAEEAWPYELYRATCETLRQQIGADWHRSLGEQQRGRRVYLLSFEYMPGKLLRQNAQCLGIFRVLKEALLLLGSDFASMEAVEREISLGNGALGTISYDQLTTAAAMGLPLMGYGIRYKNGRLKQTVVDGTQVEHPDNWVSNKNPWEHEKAYFYVVPLAGGAVKAIPYDLPVLGYGVSTMNTLRIWRAEALEDIDFHVFSRGDFSEAYGRINRAHAIVEFLYPDETSPRGRHLRLMQEVFFASATMQDILRTFHKDGRARSIDSLAEAVCIQINDVQSTFSMAVCVQILHDEYALSYQKAISLSEALFHYTNFSVQAESFEQWSREELEAVCPHLLPTLEAIQAYYAEKEGGMASPVIYDGQTCHLAALALCVARRYVFLTQSHYYAFQKLLPQSSESVRKKLLHIRMGVSMHNWLRIPNPSLHALLSERLGVDVTADDDADHMRSLLQYRDDADFLQALGEIKTAHKQRVAAYVYEKNGLLINPLSIYDMQLGVFHESKRQLLNALDIAGKFFDLLDHPYTDVPEVTYFFSGKAAPNYYAAKEILHFINALGAAIDRAHPLREKIKVVFIEDYNLSRMQSLIPACDIYQNLGFGEKEPCGTTVIKAMLNGAVPCTSPVGIGLDLLERLGDQACYGFGPTVEEAMERGRQRGRLDRTLAAHADLRGLIDRLLRASRTLIDYDFRRLFDLIVRYDDSFSVLEDLPAYRTTRRQMEQDYYEEEAWNRKCLQNIAHSGAFSMKATLIGYSEAVWGWDERTKDA